MTTATNREMKQLGQASDSTNVIQTVSSCLTLHEECSGLYSDQQGTVLVRCVCKCHERGLFELETRKRLSEGEQPPLSNKRRADDTAVTTATRGLP
jgi:hypothetical protein